MLIDTHCHLNIMTKNDFDKPITIEELTNINFIIGEAKKNGVEKIINVGTSYQESLNCIDIAKKFNSVFATVGIHPNDLNSDWKNEIKKLEILIKETNNKIVGIGECGLDKHYENYDIKKQIDAFKYQIEIALAHDIALVVHTRDAAEETLMVLEEYKNDIKKGIIHCFSEDLTFAKIVTDWGFCIGLGGTITYPKNDSLRLVAKEIPLEKIVLETDSPYLPPQKIRGQKNSPKEILTIASFLAELKGVDLNTVAKKTTKNAVSIFKLEEEK